MAGIEVEKVRNVALLAHSGAGKTTLVEAILYTSGVINRMGTVDEGNTVADYEPEEIDRKLTICSAIVNCEYSGYRLYLIDTPGFLNFIEDARGCLRVADGAVVVVSAVSGIKPETRKVWKYADEFNVPRLVFVNEMDKENVNFPNVIEELEKTFELEAIPLNIPIGSGEDFTGVVDIVNKKAYKFDGKKVEEIDMPSYMQAQVEDFRKKLVEKVAESDDSLLEKYLEGEELSQDEISKGVKEGSINRKFIPVVCGSAAKNIAIAQLIDTIITCLPSPVESAELIQIEGKNPKDESVVNRKPLKDEPLSAYVFKTIADPFAGQLTIFRVYSGEMKADSSVLNSTKNAKERIGQVSFPFGKEHPPAQILGPGEIGVVTKLKETITGDTLCVDSSPIVFDQVKFAEPVISYAIEPKSKGDEEKVSAGLHRILDEDPTLRFHRDEETNEMIISGMGQVHIEVALQKLKRKFGVEVEMHSPKIPYRETIKKSAKAQGKYKKQSGGRGQYGNCWIEIEPLPKGKGFEFVDKIVGGAIPKNYIPAVEKGIVEKMKEGILAGFPLVDFRVKLYDGSYHSVDSSDMAFKIAGSLALKKATLDASPVLLEPVANIEVIIPEDYLGAVIGDLNSKRGKVQGMDQISGGNQKINALVPMAEMLTYANQLHSITSGRGMYSMEFLHYEEVPHNIAQKIIEERKKEKEEE